MVINCALKTNILPIQSKHYVIILVEKSAMYNVKFNYNDVRMFSIESDKKTKVPAGLYSPSQSYYHICSREFFF